MESPIGLQNCLPNVNVTDSVTASLECLCSVLCPLWITDVKVPKIQLCNTVTIIRFISSLIRTVSWNNILFHIFSSVLIPVPGEGGSIISLYGVSHSPTDLIVIKAFFLIFSPNYSVYIFLLLPCDTSPSDIYAPHLFSYHVF